jgi:hypothetical protein
MFKETGSSAEATAFKPIINFKAKNQFTPVPQPWTALQGRFLEYHRVKSKSVKSLKPSRSALEGRVEYENWLAMTVMPQIRLAAVKFREIDYSIINPTTDIVQFKSRMKTKSKPTTANAAPEGQD